MNNRRFGLLGAFLLILVIAYALYPRANIPDSEIVSWVASNEDSIISSRDIRLQTAVPWDLDMTYYRVTDKFLANAKYKYNTIDRIYVGEGSGGSKEIVVALNGRYFLIKKRLASEKFKTNKIISEYQDYVLIKDTRD